MLLADMLPHTVSHSLLWIIRWLQFCWLARYQRWCECPHSMPSRQAGDWRFLIEMQSCLYHSYSYTCPHKTNMCMHFSGTHDAWTQSCREQLHSGDITLIHAELQRPNHSKVGHLLKLSTQRALPQSEPAPLHVFAATLHEDI